MREIAAEGFLDVEQCDSCGVNDRFIEPGRGVFEAFRERSGRAIDAERFAIERR